MSMKDKVLARIAELETQRSELKGKAATIADKGIEEKRGLTDAEKSEFDGFRDEMRSVGELLKAAEERLADLTEDEAREVREAEVRKTLPERKIGGAKAEDAPVYRKDNQAEVSYFRDLYRATMKGDHRAAERLDRNARIESRALSTAATDGGEFAPPLWLVDEYVKLARASRVSIDLFDGGVLPSGISSINLPKVATGTTVGVQTENGAVTNTDMVTSSLTTDITTVAGAQTVSLQLLEQSGTPFDRVVMEDLAGAHAVEVNRQSAEGNGTTELRGVHSAAGKQTIVYDDVSPTLGELYAKLADAQSRVHAARFMPADAIIMHPRRWAWAVSQLDSTGRPFVVPETNGPFNSLSTDLNTVPQGRVGTILGIPVYLDATLSTTGLANALTGGTEDKIYVVHRQDIKVWESPVRAEAFKETFADTMSVYFRLYNYSAQIPDRYGAAVIQISGTGLVTPTFA